MRVGVISETWVVQNQYGFYVVDGLEYFAERDVATGQCELAVVLADDDFEAGLRAGSFTVDGERV